ncbi:RAP protein, putative [Plasmodium yoelii]|uniref:RAP protein n=3 Tax=Plasmodium yoelii TaxID=5861 RepID=A0AAE9WYC6_PLAYO|nr:RAP protein, putative [Plasmodium yoelii]WBY58742.1 RAP protein [Plasmodium yoelii yoelii]CDU19019.1 RAP protein, putative [Plasmodium yoelii]VTZ79604.1 RAP protein, putative [Plasmodium yoelii]|eukprot:XP_022812448.1 RAP protein, putative [Plasmodium yoelii]
MVLLFKPHIWCGKFLITWHNFENCKKKCGKYCCIFYQNVCNKNNNKKEIKIINKLSPNLNSFKNKNKFEENKFEEKKFEENKFEEKKFDIDDLNKYNLKNNKISFDILNQIINYVLLEKNDNKLNIENLLLLLIIFNKNFPDYKNKFENEFYLKVLTCIMSKIKLKLHYLYTSKMLIYALNILTNLKLADNDILKIFINKCDYFIKNEEYEIYDLVGFLRIFSEIYIFNKHYNSINLQNVNWVLIKNICNKLVYNFDFLFLPYKDNTFSFNLRKKISRQIFQIVNTQNGPLNFNKNKLDTKRGGSTNDRNGNNNNDNGDNDDDNGDDSIYAGSNTPNAIILDTLFSICKSLKDLNYSHIPLSNEITNIIKIYFFNKNKLINLDQDYDSLNKIFYIMNCFLFLKLDYHMFYKYILNNFIQFLKNYKNLLLIFFLLSKNNLFPSKVIHIFDSIFLQNIKQKKYNSQNLIIILESYALHKYRNSNIIQHILNFCNIISLEYLSFTKTGKVVEKNGVCQNSECDGEERGGNSLCNSLTILDKIKILYSLFHLDIYIENILVDITTKLLNKPELIHEIPYKFLIKLLLSFCYFSFKNKDIYNMIIKNLIKYDILIDNIYLNQLKIIELSLRTQHVPNVYNKLDTECYEYMNYIKNKEKEIEYNIKSDLQKEVKNILLTFNLTPLEEVSIGPYNVDFIEEDKTFQNISKNEIYYKKESNNSTKIILSDKKNYENIGKIIIEVNGEHHFYRNTKSYTSFSKLKHKLLSDLGYIVINIPYFDWAILKTYLNKKSYIKKIINDKSNIDMVSILPYNQQTLLLKNKELQNIKNTIHSEDAKSAFINSIAEFRRKKKLKFLKKKIKEI